MYSIKESFALSIIITKSWEVRFSIRFMLMLQHRFANATQVLLCIINRLKLETMKNEPNNIYIP